MTEPAVVVIEDDPNIADLIDTYFRNEGFRVLQHRSGEGGLRAVTDHTARLVILDVGLEGSMDGFAVCRTLRSEHPDVLVIMVTARDDEIDRVLGLELGADDYVTKPFSPRELVARARALLRRAEHTTTAEPAVFELTGRLRVDSTRHECQLDGAPIALAAREFDLLEFLCRNRGVALSRQQLLSGVWGYDWVGDERTVDVHIRQLRKKLGDELPLTTVWGTGYRLD